MSEHHDSQSIGRRINEILLLSVLRRGRMHGYQIALDVEARSGGYFRFNHGTLYPILHKLEKAGMIAGDWATPPEGRARKEYALTPAGRTYLEASAEEWRTLEARMNTFLSDASTDDEVRTSAA